jgi:hypothetical protein
MDFDGLTARQRASPALFRVCSACAQALSMQQLACKNFALKKSRAVQVPVNCQRDAGPG